MDLKPKPLQPILFACTLLGLALGYKRDFTPLKLKVSPVLETDSFLPSNVINTFPDEPAASSSAF